MRIARNVTCVVTGAALVAAFAFVPAFAQEKKAEAAPQGMPPLPKPGPEHEILKGDVGEWDATVESWMEPGKPPSVSKGVETNAMGCGGLCLITDFKGQLMAQPFAGHGVAVYDIAAKKYTSTWMDSMSPGLMVGSSTYDSAKKTMTGWMEGPDMTGKMMKMKAVSEWKDANTRVFTMYMTGPDGKEVPGMKITYKRRP